MFDINFFQEDLKSNRRDFHSVVTISLGELIEWGWFKIDDDDWRWEAKDEEQYQRVCKKFIARFWNREIGILPPGEWKRRYVGLMNEIMPKYIMLYDILDDEDILQESRKYDKYRNIDSDFPQTLLGRNKDYASYGADHEGEELVDGSPLDKMLQLQKYWNDVDVMILNECEVLFSALVSVNLNTW